MLLITTHEWLGPGRRMTPEERERTTIQESQTAFATRRPLWEALKLIKGYSDAYKERYRLAVEFRLISVATIEDLPDHVLGEYARVQLAEHLPQSAAEFG